MILYVGWLAWLDLEASARHQIQILSQTQSAAAQFFNARDLSNEPLSRKIRRDSLSSKHFQWRQWATFLIFCFKIAPARFWWAIGIFWDTKNRRSGSWKSNFAKMRSKFKIPAHWRHWKLCFLGRLHLDSANSQPFLRSRRLKNCARFWKQPSIHKIQAPTLA